MNAFQGRALSLAALTSLILAATAKADETQPPALLLPPAILPAPFAGQPLALSEANAASPAPLTAAAPSTTDLLPPPSLRSHQADFEMAMTSAWGSYAPSCEVPSCTAAVGKGSGCYCPCWFTSVGALVMQRDNRGQFQTSFDSGAGVTALGTGDLQPPVAGGVDVTVGRWFCCGQWGLGFNYWGAWPTTQTAEALGANAVGALNTNFDFTGLDYNGGILSDAFDGAVHHEIRHRNEFHSAEFNFLGGNGAFAPWGLGAGDADFGYGWTLGIRYFRFNDDFALLADDVDTVFSGAPEEATYDLRTQNDLLGFQLGGGLSYRLWRNLSVFGMGKAGLYGVNARQEQYLGGPSGLATINTGAFAGQVYAVETSNTDLAMLGEIDLGGSWQMSSRWSAQIAYRFVGIAGVAIVDDQIPSDFTNLAQASEVNTNGSLILHGAYIGLTYAY